MPDSRPINFPVPLDLPLFTAKDVGEVLTIPSRRVVLLVEQGIVTPSAQAKGRGNARKHSFLDIFVMGILDILGETLGIAPRYLRGLATEMRTIQSERVLDGDLPGSVESIPLSDALSSFGSGKTDLPAYLLLPARPLTILAESINIDGERLPNSPEPQKPRDMWLANWSYAYEPTKSAEYVVCIQVNYPRFARRLLQRAASYLEKE
jgi:hypothetical protein